MGSWIDGRWAELYDIFVDWEGRLGREMPGLLRRLRAAGASQVLDAGCGTGRHLQALLEAGFDAHGADMSPDLLRRAEELLGERSRLHRWRMGDPPPESLRARAPFDAIISLGNVWPQITKRDDARAACRAFRRLCAPGATLLMGLKAAAIQRERSEAYMPLLRRERNGKGLFFVRFLDFEGAGDKELCLFHILAVPETGERALHRVNPMRVWSPEGLRIFLEQALRGEVRISGRIDDPTAAVESENIFVHARIG